MKKLGSILLSIVFAICLLATLLLGIVREKLNVGTVMDLVADMLKPVATLDYPDTGLYYPEYGKKISTVQYEEYGFDLNSLDLSNIDLENLNINELVTQVLQENGVEVDAEFVAEVLEDKQSQEVLNKYVGQITEYVVGTRTELEIDATDVQNVVNNAIDKYEVATGEVVDRTGLNEMIETSVVEASTTLSQGLDEAKSEMIDEETMQLMQTGFQFIEKITAIKTLMLCIAVCVVLAALILLINKSFFGMCKYISIPGLIDGILIVSFGVLLYSIVPGIVEEIMTSYGISYGLASLPLENLLVSIKKMTSTVGFIAIIISVVVGALGFVFGRKKAESKKDKAITE